MKLAFFLLILIKLSLSIPLKNDADDNDFWKAQYNLNLFEGDILLDDDDDPTSIYRNAKITAKKWSNGVIPYVIDSKSGYTADEKKVILDAMKTIEMQTNRVLRFKERKLELYFIKIQNTGNGCYSYVGRTSSSQTVSLDKRGCVIKGTVIHELLHAAGFVHEQNRPDRDDYIDIRWENIYPEARDQFIKESIKTVNTFNQPYDIKSIMHYRYNGFSMNGLPTIVSKVSSFKTTDIGRGDWLTDTDVKKVKLLYGSNKSSRSVAGSNNIKFTLILIIIYFYFNKY